MLVAHARPRATFVIYGKTAEAAERSWESCEVYRRTFHPEGLCRTPDLTFFGECPVECDTAQMIPLERDSSDEDD